MRRISRLLLTSISALLAVVVFATPAFALDWSNTVVVIIANPDHDSDSVPTLSYANSDYDMMLEFVRDGLGVPKHNIKAIKNADRNAFKRVFDPGRWLDQQVQRTNGANVLVYISAHGVPDDDKRAYFVPSNGLPSYPEELYSRDKVVEALERAKALQTNRSSQVLAIFDSCFSGSSYAGDVSPGKTGLPTVPIRAKQPITIMSATQGKGIAYPDEESGLSALTSAFLLGAAGKADETAEGGNGDGTLSMGELAAYVKRTVPYKSRHNQQPQIDLEGTYDLPVYSVTKFRAQMAKAEADSRWQALKAELRFPAVLDLNEDQLRQQIPRLRKLSSHSRRLTTWCNRNTEACKGFQSDLAGTPDLILGQRMRVDDHLAWLQAQDPETFDLNCQVYALQCNKLKARNSAYSCLHAEEMAYECLSEEEVLLAEAKQSGTRTAWLSYLNGCQECNEATSARQQLARLDALEQEDLRRRMAADNSVQDCDRLAGDPDHPDRKKGFMLQEGVAFANIDARKAISACEQALDVFPGYVRLQSNLARALDAEDSATSNVKAVELYQQLALAGDALSQAYFGSMYEFGEGVTQDYAEALRWYRKAAEQGDATGQSSLGAMYANGNGVRQDYAEAVRWFRKSAAQGDAYGQNYLGWMYQHGTGVRQDYAEALRWYRKAAEQGDASGQINLGWMYENGNGVEKSYSEAVKWYSKAAEQGNKIAQQELARLNELDQEDLQGHMAACKVEKRFLDRILEDENMNRLMRFLDRLECEQIRVATQDCLASADFGSEACGCLGDEECRTWP